MQIQKAKQGYKLVNSTFGKYEIPEEWEITSLENCCNVLDSKRVPINSEERSKMKGNIPYYGANGVQDYINQHIFDEDLILLAEDGGYFDEYQTRPIAYYVKGKCWVNNHAHVLTNKIGFDQKWIFYSLVHKNILPWINGTTRTKLNQSELLKIEISKPHIKEQEKIASILSNVDSLIQQTQEIIEQTQRLKKGLMQKLLTKGIEHATFKFENIGKRFLNVEIPKTWDMKKFMDIITVHDNYIELDDNIAYTRITVKRRHEGVVLRDIVKGKEILTKNQYQVRSGDFVVSRRQIIHNACGLIPKEFDGAVVSNEYSSFSGSKYLDIDYFDWFSQTDLFKKTIIVTTHGVDIEKYVFLLDEWLKLKMPLPSISEQKKIVEILLNVENKLTKEQRYKSYLESLKKGVMQKLLTGQIRVKL